MDLETCAEGFDESRKKAKPVSVENVLKPVQRYDEVWSAPDPGAFAYVYRLCCNLHGVDNCVAPGVYDATAMPGLPAVTTPILPVSAATRLPAPLRITAPP